MEQGDPGWLRGHQASATESTESQSCGGWKEPLELPQPSPPQHIHTADAHKASRWVWISPEETPPPPPTSLCQSSVPGLCYPHSDVFPHVQMELPGYHGTQP